MEILPNTSPAPRLLNTVAVDVATSGGAPASTRHKLKGASVFSGNGRAIFIGLLLGGAAITAAGFLVAHGGPLESEFAAVRQFFAVRTHTITHAAKREPDPVVAVQLSPSLVRVTAIALGHPRLAIINGQQVAEGDSITVRAPGRAISVTLQVVRISEAGIELTDGTHIITTRLPVGNGSEPAAR